MYKRQAGWDTPDFDMEAAKQSHPWTVAVVVTGPPGRMRVWAAPPVLEDRVVKPVNVTVAASPSSPSGKVFVVDFGVNLAGVCRLTNIRVRAGTNITLRHGEILQHSGLPDLRPSSLDPRRIYVGNLRGAKATDIYIARGLSLIHI